MTARILLAGASSPAARGLAVLLRAEYLSVAVSSGGAAALELARSWRPDLIVLDGGSGGDGLALCRRLRAEPLSRYLPLLLVTTPDDSASRLRALELSADEALGAPLDMDLLLARLHALVRNKRLQDEWRIRGQTALALGFPAREESASDALDSEALASGGSVAGTRALVIEDDDQRAAALQDLLARDGLSAGRAATADQAAALCGAVGFDLVLLSLELLTDDPLRIVAALRAAEPTRHVPLLLLAEPSSRARLLRAFALGADDCAHYTAAPAELRARARNQLRRKLHQDRLRADLGQALEMVLTDPLTGCYNRRHLLRHLSALLAAGPPRGVSLLLLDIDQFKAVNDRLGHAAGDAALVDVVAALRPSLRALDSIARAGGEEFVVLAPGCTLAEAMALAERLRGAVEALVIPVDSGEPCRLTVSIGVVASTEIGEAPASVERLLHLAGRALDAARKQGGNAVAALPASGRDHAAD